MKLSTINKVISEVQSPELNRMLTSNYGGTRQRPRYGNFKIQNVNIQELDQEQIDQAAMIVKATLAKHKVPHEVCEAAAEYIVYQNPRAFADLMDQYGIDRLKKVISRVDDMVARLKIDNLASTAEQLAPIWDKYLADRPTYHNVADDLAGEVDAASDRKRRKAKRKRKRRKRRIFDSLNHKLSVILEDEDVEAEVEADASEADTKPKNKNIIKLSHLKAQVAEAVKNGISSSDFISNIRKSGREVGPKATNVINNMFADSEKSFINKTEIAKSLEKMNEDQLKKRAIDNMKRMKQSDDIDEIRKLKAENDIIKDKIYGHEGLTKKQKDYIEMRRKQGKEMGRRFFSPDIAYGGRK